MDASSGSGHNADGVEGESLGMTIGRVMDWTEARRDAIRVAEEDEDEDEERERGRTPGVAGATASTANGAAARAVVKRESPAPQVQESGQEPAPAPTSGGPTSRSSTVSSSSTLPTPSSPLQMPASRASLPPAPTSPLPRNPVHSAAFGASSSSPATPTPQRQPLQLRQPQIAQLQSKLRSPHTPTHAHNPEAGSLLSFPTASALDSREAVGDAEVEVQGAGSSLMMFPEVGADENLNAGMGMSAGAQVVPPTSVGQKRRHRAMLVENSSPSPLGLSSSPSSASPAAFTFGQGGGAFALGHGQGVGVGRRRTKSLRNAAGVVQGAGNGGMVGLGLGGFGQIGGIGGDEMDVEEEGRERKRVARR